MMVLTDTQVLHIAKTLEGGGTSESTPIDDRTFDLRLLFPDLVKAQTFLTAVRSGVKYAALLHYAIEDRGQMVQVICAREDWMETE